MWRVDNWDVESIDYWDVERRLLGCGEKRLLGCGEEATGMLRVRGCDVASRLL